MDVHTIDAPLLPAGGRGDEEGVVGEGSGVGERFEVSLRLRDVGYEIPVPEPALGAREQARRLLGLGHEEDRDGSSTEHAAAAAAATTVTEAQKGEASFERVVYRSVKDWKGANRSQRMLRVLHDVSIDLQPGKLYALMGPSGAGKTSLLDVLSNHAQGKIFGHITCNGREGLPEVYRSLCCVVPQDDVLLAALTPRESLRFMAELRLPQSMPREQKHARVEVVLNLLSLQQCAETRVGNVDERGISGGERKRVSIALEMVINPSILLLDEPTSGLDSHLAEEVVSMLASLAHGTDRGGHGAALHSDVDADADTVVAPTSTPGSGGGQGARRLIVSTIHQPSFKILCEFDWLTLLTRGRVAYNGPTAELAAYFSSIGHAPPTYENPCDFVMRVLQDPVEIPKCIEAWSAVATTAATKAALDSTSATEQISTSANGQLTVAGANPHVLLGDGNGNGAVTVSGHASKDDEAPPGWDEFVAQPKHYATSRWYQCQVLMQRTFVDTLKDKRKFLGGILLKLSVGIMTGCVWLNQAEDKNEAIFSMNGSLFMAAWSASMNCLLLTVTTFPAQRSMLVKEYRNAAFSLAPYYAATLAMQFVFQTIYSIFLVAPLIWLVGFNLSASALLYFLLVIALTACIGATLGIFFGSMVSDFDTAQQTVMPMMVFLALASGYVVLYKDMGSGLRFFYTISFFQYAFSSLQIVTYRGVDFMDCDPVPDAPTTVSYTCSSNLTVPVDLGNSTKCPLDCYKTGDQYLRDNHMESSDGSNLARNFGILLGMLLVACVGGYYTLRFRIVTRNNKG